MPRAVTTTSSTESCAMDRRFARKSITDVRMAAAYSSGGSKPINTSSGDSSGMGTRGRKEIRSDEHQQRRGEPDPIGQRRHGEHRGDQAQDGDGDSHMPCFHPHLMVRRSRV